MKKHKQSTPTETIYRIKDILSKIGILTKDEHYGQHPFYSCRISIGNSEISKYNWGTNGKGRSFEYSIASGYAEILERLQNNSLLITPRYAVKSFLNSLPSDSSYTKNLIEKKLVLDYIHDKDEELWDIKSIIEHCKNDLLQILDIDSEERLNHFLIKELELHENIVIPYFSVNDNTEKLLPIEIIKAATGSNGMCAGNTPEEALVQGFCEIFERHVTKQLYYQEITPPNIPFSYFENTPVYDELIYLKNNSKLEIIIKDCSLNQGYPVIGVLFLDQENQRYNFKLGADFLPHIALERCLTEIHQGFNNIPTLPFNLIEMKDNPTSYPIERPMDFNFLKITRNTTGFWPISLFSGNSSYQFENFNSLYGKSDKEDLKYSIELINKQGYNIYIRDNSILGFPTYHIVVPGMSQLINNKDLNVFLRIYNLISVKELHSIDKIKARKIAEAIDKNYYLIKEFLLSNSALYLYCLDEDLLDLDLEILAFMLFYYIADIKNAKKYIDLFLTDKNRTEYGYYFAISDYITLNYIKNYTAEETKAILIKGYGIIIAEEIISDLIDPDNIFINYDFPNCFDCDNCPVSISCTHEHVLKIQKKMHEFADKLQIKQINLNQIVF